ncbi:MAG: histone-lysine N-methyltransferase [Deltaproteobacteria bacterium]|jgi:isopropylmalate/homocitrate/citramalate synthase|nr:histone-lysine N-methyltransferase [Deltaproteobacteria bacterium]
MAKWDAERRVLNHEHTRFWRYTLQDVTEPNLQRAVFPYDEVCRIDFDHKILPISPASDRFITDTTFRDGQQARPPFTVRQIVDLFDLLHRLSGPHGVVRQTEFFLYSDRDREAVERCRERGYRFPEITGWIRANRKDLKRVQEMGLKETGILTSVSDYHIFLKLNKRRKQVFEEYLDVVRGALEMNLIPRCHFEDVTRADIYGFCVPFAQALMKLREESEVDIKIRLCDTMGYGVTYPGAALPRAVDKLVRAMIDDAGVPGRLLEWHGHNDFHKVLVNAAWAWLYGCAAANGAILGFGERTGNTPLEGLIIEYIGLRGDSQGADTAVITEIAEYVKREMGVTIPPNYPLAGIDFNATSAGIHIDGVIKNEEIYNIFDTEKILNRPMTVVISDKSGLAGIAHWVNTHLMLNDDQRVDKRHPGIAKIYRWVMDQYAAGRVTSISHGEIERQARRHLPEYFVSDFDRIKWQAREMAAYLLEETIETPQLKSMKPKLIEPLLKKLVAEHPFIQFAYATDMEGRKITKNITQVVDKAKYEKVGLHEDYSDRTWFIEPLKDGQTHVSELYTSRMTGRLCLTVSGPIRDARDQIIGVCGLDIKFEDLAKAEKKENLKPSLKE